jgi:UDP-N-acetylmuramoyl-L-alanyl-D-glutamate--2,6-diaminopimelate ligase
MTDTFSFADDSEPESAGDRPRRGGVRLAGLLPKARFIGCDDLLARGYADDPDGCRRGEVFFARLTADGDGHNEVERAVAGGATGIVAERIVPTGGVPLCLVRSTDDALARVAHALAGHPADRMRVIAVAGTSGKTTTAWLAASVLAEGGLRVGLLTDLGGVDAAGDLLPAIDGAAAGPLAARLAALEAGGCTHVVVEVTSRMLAARVLAGIEYDTLVVPTMATAPPAATAPGPGGEVPASAAGVSAAGRHLLRRILGGLAADGCLVADRGGRLARAWSRRASTRPRMTRMVAGTAAGGDVRIRTLERSLHGRTLLLEAGGDVLPVAVDTPVASFARNVACAAAVGLRYGVSPEAIARGIEAVGSVPGRVERIDCGQDTAVFVDVTTSGPGLGATLASLRRLTTGRLAVLVEEEAAAAFGRQAFSRVARRWCDEVVTVPAHMLDERGPADALAAYARVDRLLAGLGAGDCLLVVGRVAVEGGLPPADAVPLAAVVSGWLRLAHPAAATGLGRLRAA